MNSTKFFAIAIRGTLSFNNIKHTSSLLSNVKCSASPSLTQVCHNWNIRRIKQLRPDPSRIPSLRAQVHLPEDGYYTTRPLKQTKLGGRDPITKRVIHHRIGGGEKREHYWVDYYREGPTVEGEFYKEKILSIIDEPNRSCHVALVNNGEKMRYVIATTSMKVGQIIQSSSCIPRMPIHPIEGDSFPIGALPIGTRICCVSLTPGGPGFMATCAGMSAILKSKVGLNYIMQMPNKKMYVLDPKCMCVAGQISNPEHQDIPIGSPNRLRELGWRPRSGLRQRKTGYHGRKIKPIPPPIDYVPKKEPNPIFKLEKYSQQPPYEVIQCTWTTCRKKN